MSDPQTSPRRRRQGTEAYHHGDLKRALVDAALQLIAEKGARGFSLSEAARRAGVSPAAPYRHFSDKAGLTAAVAEQGFLDLHRALDSGNSPDARTALVETGRRYVQWAVAHPDHYRVMFGEGLDKADHTGLLEASSRAFDDLLDAITACLDAGVLRGDDARHHAGPLWSLVHGIASLAIGGELNHAGVDETPADLAVRAIGDFLN